jgi:TRAP-type transport system periplasmic protein
MPSKLGRFFASLAFTAVLFGAQAQAQTAPTVMKLATATINDSQHEWMKRFVPLVEEKSGGRIKGEIYPASQLGSNQRMVEGTQFGSIQAYVGPVDFMTGVDSRFQMLGAPGLFASLSHANRTLQQPGFKEAFSELGSDKGLKLVGAFPTGAYVFTTTSPAKGFKDLAGRKIRVLASPMQTEQLRALGATPVPMPLSEVLPALQQGALDGAMSTMDVFVPLRYYDTAEYLVGTEHAVLVTGVVLSRIWFDELPADLQDAVVEAAEETTAGIADWVANVDEQKRKAWTEAGGELVGLSEAERKELFELMRPIGEEVAARKPGDKEFFDLLREASEAAR